MNDDGFKVVRYRKKYSRNKKCEAKPTERFEGSVEDIQIAVEKAAMQVESSGLSSWVVNKIRSLIGDRRVKSVYVIGNGHFDAPWEPGTHQLALILRMCREFGAEMIFQEPCISKAEREYLNKQEKVVCRDSTDVQVRFDLNDLNIVCVVVLIHGVHSILDDFLSFIWHSNLHNIILICNDYRDFDLIVQTAAEFSNYNFLNAFCKCATFIALPEYAPHPSFFSYSSLAYVEDSISPQELIVSA
ncbi:hypothetical protein KIN20_014446 [Parelaphostrongylus tenuis]|uniref:SRR1-like domain-containing protein n=1 Tax=Parelaphostrongylus tenuis TaxID=148309 RepID=A0AAD5MXD5_PARTN|nr:hypothetical protein KIN20_014446 [Parelaphostrongylus tenuis]